MKSNTVHPIYILTLLLIPSFAFAYVDPGSGHMIIQMLYLLAFSSLFYVKKIFLFFRNLIIKPGEKSLSMSQGQMKAEPELKSGTQSR